MAEAQELQLRRASHIEECSGFAAWHSTVTAVCHTPLSSNDLRIKNTRLLIFMIEI
jgi:hypothetical protein